MESQAGSFKYTKQLVLHRMYFVLVFKKTGGQWSLKMNALK